MTFMIVRWWMLYRSPTSGPDNAKCGIVEKIVPPLSKARSRLIERNHERSRETWKRSSSRRYDERRLSRKLMRVATDRFRYHPPLISRQIKPSGWSPI